ncbi:Hypp9603 [Branchiostoma lanceolatum]|uniref:Hypp9603 protein n=1 Tax=Branchiostoma lanceolatum TaxID=7740 RepID=A0A8S4MNP3_BRALA|nr:Hypp9603 [Branchiostoma lanceolatum]
METYVRTGRTLYCDNYCTSPELFLDFSDANINTCGTKRNRKGIPNAFKDATLTTPQQMFCMTNGALLAMKYKNRRGAKMLTTAHSAKMLAGYVDPDGVNSIVVTLADLSYSAPVKTCFAYSQRK